MISALLLLALAALFLTATASAVPSAVKSRLPQIREYLAANRLYDASDKLDEADKFLKDPAPENQAEIDRLTIEVQALREQLTAAQKPKTAAPASVPAPVVPAPVPTVAPASPAPTAPAPSASSAIPLNLSAAKSRLRLARMNIESNRMNEVNPALDEAEKFLAGTPAPDEISAAAVALADLKDLRHQMSAWVDPEITRAISNARTLIANVKRTRDMGMEASLPAQVQYAQEAIAAVPEKNRPPLQAEFDALRATLPAEKSPEARALEDRIKSDILNCKNNMQLNFARAAEALKAAAARLQSPEARAALSPATNEQLQKDIAATETQMNAYLKQDALSRANPLLAELEQKLSTDPLQGKDQSQAATITNDIQSLATRTATALGRMPKEWANDPEIKAATEKLAQFRQKFSAYDAHWGSAAELEKLAASWRWAQKSFADWEQESPSRPQPNAIRPWRLQKTSNAISSTYNFLHDAATLERAAKLSTVPAAAALISQAQSIHEAAAKKLHDSFNQTLDLAEKSPRPTRDADLAAPNLMAVEAAQCFENTPFKDANIARAAALDKKWKDEIAALQAEGKALYAQLTAEAAARWPAIVAALNPQKSFNPAAAASDPAAFKGRTVLMENIRNRAGWDFDGHYPFAIWGQGQIPIAGRWEKIINDAFTDIRTRTHQDVDDHTDWSAILIIEGTGTINQRIHTTVIDERTREVLAKTEKYQPIPCLTCRVIALNAGPIATGAA